MKIDGSCHCGGIAYEADVDPAKVVICHCTDCQTLSGSAFRVVVPAKKEDFRLLRGSPKVYVKTAESGAQRLQAFCPECGTPIYSARPGDTPTYGLRVGAIRQRAELRPSSQLWCRSRLDWLPSLETTPQLEKQA